MMMGPGKYTDVYVQGEHIGRLLDDVQVIETSTPVIKGVMNVELKDFFKLSALSFDLELQKMSAEGRMWDKIVMPVTVNSFEVKDGTLTMRYQYDGPARVGSYRTF